MRTTGSTIFALSSGRVPAGIAVIRVSGPQAKSCLAAVCGLASPRPRHAHRVSFRRNGELIDDGLALWFPAPASATGEDLAELHAHGGRAVVVALEETLACLPDVRRAAPGEFTRRRFENGRLDLTQSEGLADLLQAETEAQRRAALAVSGGGLRQLADRWRTLLLREAAAVEVAIDYADEVDDVDPPNSSNVDRVVLELAEVLSRAPAERLKDGFRVAIVGPVNAGKSTLLNRLVGREAAIVSPIAGTTRDVVEVPVAIDGVPFTFVDCAGLRDQTDDPIERIGIARAHAEIARADLVINLGQNATGAPIELRVSSKADLASARSPEELSISGLTGTGLPELTGRLLTAARAGAGEGEVLANSRQRTHLAEAAAALQHYPAEADILIRAEKLRSALNALAELTGERGIGVLLDSIFSQFCLGK